MKNLFFCSFIFLIILTGCASRNANTTTHKTIEQKKAESAALDITFPKFNNTTNSTEIKQTCDCIILKIDSALSKLRKVEKKMTLYDKPNTPVTIWYSDTNVPVKIVHAVTNDSGKFTDQFHYYFIAGQFWYSNQLFARYIFDNDNLQYWLDENWNINEISATDFKNREMFLQNTIKKILAKNK